MEDKNRLNSDTVVMLQTDPYEIRLMQNPYDAAVGWAKGNRQSRQRLDRHGTIVVGSCETFHHYNVQGVK